jgi:hypothetical protein
MSTCTNCGATVAETDEFCGNCGTYLAWVKPDKDEKPNTEPPPATPDPEQPHAVAPAQPVAPPRKAATSTATEASEDGPQCPNCGTVNRAGAKFCRQCGTSLTEAAATRPTARRRRAHRTGGSPWPRRIVALVVVAVLVVAGFVLSPYIGSAFQTVLDKLATPSPISPNRETASAATPGHPVTAAVDGVSNQYWGAPSVGDWAQFNFGQPFRLLGVVITPGASTDPTAFAQEGRPTKVDLDVTTSTGSTTTLPIVLADKPGPQTTNMGISNVVTIRVVIQAAAHQLPGRSIALGEIEFFKR